MDKQSVNAAGEPAEEVNLNLLDPEVQACPWEAYKVMRDQGPIYQDPHTGYFIVTQYETLRKILKDDETFLGALPGHEDSAISGGYAWGDRLQKELEEKGWPYGRVLFAMNGTSHSEVRSVFEHALRPKRIKEMDGVAFEIANELVDRFVNDGRCDWTEQFAVPLPLYVIGKQAGLDDGHLPKILEWTDAYIQLFGQMCDEEQSFANVRKLIEAQHFFQPMIERFREEPGEGLLSDIVNAYMPSVGRKLNDNEVHTHIMGELFVGGAETTRNALSSGMEILITRPDVWDKLKDNPDHYLKNFIEEVLRTNSPVQGLPTYAQKDTEVEGVKIPKGATVVVRFGCANRDERRFETNPDEFDLERRKAGAHLAFGSGPHHCLGAPLARRELYWGFKTAIERFDSVQFAEGKNDFAYHPNFVFRGLKALHIEFTPNPQHSAQ